MASCAAPSNSGGGDDTAANKKQCIPCHSLDTSALLSTEQVEQRLKESSLGMWKLGNSNEEIPRLSCRFTAKNFQAAMNALNAMGVIAERENHHPDFHLTSYREVQIDVWTHSVKGITENDLTLASMLSQEVEVEYSPKWLKQHPEAQASSQQ